MPDKQNQVYRAERAILVRIFLTQRVFRGTDENGEHGTRDLFEEAWQIRVDCRSGEVRNQGNAGAGEQNIRVSTFNFQFLETREDFFWGGESEDFEKARQMSAARRRGNSGRRPEIEAKKGPSWEAGGGGGKSRLGRCGHMGPGSLIGDGERDVSMPRLPQALTGEAIFYDGATPLSCCALLLVGRSLVPSSGDFLHPLPGCG